MELLEKKSASEVASEILDDFKHGRRKIVFGTEKNIKPKKNKKFLFLALLIICFVPFLLIKKEFQIKGSINVFGKNCEIIFLDEEEKSTISNEQGDFSIFLKEGIYKIYIKENVPEKYKNPETTPFLIKLNRDLENIRIHIPNI